MSTKTEWETRIGMLLDSRKHMHFKYSFKPPDSRHGGQPRLDWFACDVHGKFWLIEVKSLPMNRQSLNLHNDVTPGQRDALTSVTESLGGVALLAVGRGNALHFFNWRQVRCQLEQPSPNPLLPLEDSFLTLIWTGPKGWTHPLYTYVAAGGRDTAPTPNEPSPPPSRRTPSR